MRFWSQAMKDYLLAAEHIDCRILLKIDGRDDTGSVVSSCFWSGEEDRQFQVGNQFYLFKAIGPGLQFPQIDARAGLEARRHIISIANVDDDVESALAGHDLNFAPVKALAVLVKDESSVSSPEMILSGWVDGFRVETGAAGGASSIQITVADAAMPLTRSIDRIWSDSSQIARSKRYNLIVPGTENTYTTPNTITIPPLTTSVEIIAIGGGGGGANGFGHPGQPGSSTNVVVKDAAGNEVLAINASAGSAGSGFVYGIVPVGACSPDDPGTTNYPPFGSGGAGGIRSLPRGEQTVHCYKGNPGLPAEAVDQVIGVGPGYLIEIASVGAGGQGAYAYGGSSAASDGHAGAVIVKTTESSDDRLFRYCAVAGEVEIEWVA